MSAPKQIKRGCGCFPKLLLFVVFVLALLFVATDHYFNLQSNITNYAFRDSSAPMEVQLANGNWKAITSVNYAEMEHALDERGKSNGIHWRCLSVRRAATRTKEKFAAAFFDAEVNVIEIIPQSYHFQTSFLEHFALTTAKERLESEDLDFAITANFRDPQGKPLGLVVHKGVQRNRSFPAWTGYFFVKDGKPWFGPKSLFEETPGVLSEASQGYPSLMKNHTVFSYVDLAPNRNFDGNKITYRALAGMRQNGTIVFILSGNGGIMNVAEVAELAKKLNLQHATLLDGGRALQYSLKMGEKTHHFTAFNTELDIGWSRLKPQRSPVFIGVKRE